MEYGDAIWDPFFLQSSDIHKIEIVQGKAARFISGDYKSRDRGCVTRMLMNHELTLLEKRRKQLRLTFKFKVVEGLIKVKYVSDVIKTVKLHTLCHPTNSKKVDVFKVKGVTLPFIKTLYL